MMRWLSGSASTAIIVVSLLIAASSMPLLGRRQKATMLSYPKLKLLRVKLESSQKRAVTEFELARARLEEVIDQSNTGVENMLQRKAFSSTVSHRIGIVLLEEQPWAMRRELAAATPTQMVGWAARLMVLALGQVPLQKLRRGMTVSLSCEWLQAKTSIRELTSIPATGPGRLQQYQLLLERVKVLIVSTTSFPLRAESKRQNKLLQMAAVLYISFEPVIVSFVFEIFLTEVPLSTPRVQLFRRNTRTYRWVQISSKLKLTSISHLVYLQCKFPAMVVLSMRVCPVLYVFQVCRTQELYLVLSGSEPQRAQRMLAARGWVAMASSETVERNAVKRGTSA